jgi:DNA uptake protein ComE-like DNA-binding protein
MNLNHVSLKSSPKLNRILASLAGVVCLASWGSLALAEPMEGDAPQKAARPDKAEAQQAVEQQIAAIPEAQRAQLLQLVNQGSEAALIALPGIAATRSKAIQSARPFSSIADLLRVPGIGKATLVRILKYDPSSVAPAPAPASM